MRGTSRVKKQNTAEVELLKSYVRTMLKFWCYRLQSSSNLCQVQFNILLIICVVQYTMKISVNLPTTQSYHTI